MFPTLTIMAGLLTAAPLVIARKPNSRELFQRILPYQGLLGVGVLALGVLWLVRFLPMLSASLTSVSGVIVLAMIVANILLGFLMSFGLLSGLLSRNPTAKAKGDALFAKLHAVQVPLGVAAMLLGAVSFVV